MKYGIDLGSRKVKIVQFNNGKFSKFRMLDTNKFYKKFNQTCTDKIIEYLGMDKDDEITTTGYGRHLFKIRGLKSISELFAHALGASYITGEKSFLLMDIGAQDCKVIQINNGKVVDFITNDKCAASTGRFVENMANCLGVTVKEICKHYKNPVKLTSTCAIFTESELIGKISEGSNIDNLCAGVNYSVYEKLVPLLDQYSAKKLVMSGGGALNTALRKIIETNTKIKIILPEHSQFTGAIGCCLVENKDITGRD